MRDPLLLRRAFHERLLHLEHALEAIINHPEPLTNGAAALIERTQSLIDGLRRAVDTRWTRTASLPPDERNRRRFRALGDLQAALRELVVLVLPVLEGCRPSYIPFEAEPVVEETIAKTIPHLRLNLVLHGSDRYNYSVTKLRARFDVLPGGSPSEADDLVEPALRSGDFILLSVPRLERDAAAVHSTVLGHEMGHLRNLGSRVDRIPEWLPPQFVEDARVKEEASAEVDEYRGTVSRWIRELIADLYSVVLIGPAAILCLEELTGSLQFLRADSWTHPGADRRLAAMFELLLHMGWFPDAWKRPTSTGSRQLRLETMLARLRQEVQNAPARLVDIEGRSGEGAQVGWEFCRWLLPGLYQRCLETVPAEQHFVPDRWAEVEQAADRLQAGIPHGEYVNGDKILPASYRVIINAGWLVRAASLESLGRTLGFRELGVEAAAYTITILNGLTLKSFEIAAYRKANAGLTLS